MQQTLWMPFGSPSLLNEKEEQPTMNFEIKFKTWIREPDCDSSDIELRCFRTRYHHTQNAPEQECHFIRIASVTLGNTRPKSVEAGKSH